MRIVCQPATSKIAAACAVFVTLLVSLISDAAESGSDNPFPSGNITQPAVTFRMAVFCLPTCPTDAPAIFAAAAKAVDPHLASAKTLSLLRRDTDRRGDMSVENDVPHRLPPPDASYLRSMGFGLTPKQLAHLPSSQQALIFDFSHPRADRWKALINANIVVESVARKSGGLIWDEASGGMYSPDEWKARRIDAYDATSPDVSTQIQIRVEAKKPIGRAVTSGMSKFGLPDLVIQEFKLSNYLQISALMNAIAERLAEGGQFDRFGHLYVDLRGFKSQTAGYIFVKFLRGGSTATLRISGMKAVGAEGDPSNDLVQIEFDRYEGASSAEREEAMLTSLFGHE